MKAESEREEMYVRGGERKKAEEEGADVNDAQDADRFCMRVQMLQQHCLTSPLSLK